VCYVAATHAENRLLQAHAAMLAVRAGATPEQLAKTLDAGGLSASFDTKEAAALGLAHAASPAPTAMTRSLSSSLMAAFQPASVIELVLVVAIFNALQRWTSAYPAARYEPAVEEFVREHGARLALAPVPFSREQASCAEQLSAARKAARPG
jgi:hypothetical protein